jgi:acetyl/propionyl-CoA carboxylase alpha subunit
MGFDYDAMLSKLCVWAPDREQAVRRMRRALAEYELRGLQSNLDFLRNLVASEAFERGIYHTGLIEAELAQLVRPAELPVADEPLAAALLVASLLERGGPCRPAASPPTGESHWALAHRRRRLGL